MITGSEYCYKQTNQEPITTETTQPRTTDNANHPHDAARCPRGTSNSSAYTDVKQSDNASPPPRHCVKEASSHSDYTKPRTPVCAVPPRKQALQTSAALIPHASNTPHAHADPAAQHDSWASPSATATGVSTTPGSTTPTQQPAANADADIGSFDIESAFRAELPASPDADHNELEAATAPRPTHVTTPTSPATTSPDSTTIATTDQQPKPPPPLNPIAYRPILDRIWPHPRPNQWDNWMEYHNIYVKVRLTALPNHLSAKIPIPSGLNIPAWRSMLVGYHDKKVVDYLEYGWPADYTASTPPITSDTNHTEDPVHMQSINTYVSTELSHGALLGPFSQPPFAPWSQNSPMMTRPKKNSVNRRVIVDLSWPKPGSVNAGIRKGFYQGRPTVYTLPNIMDAADEVARIGTGSYIWCADLARAYRQLRTCPLSTPLLGITLNGEYYTDIAPPFGCRTSSMACARTTNAVVYLMRKNAHFIHCYLDDFVGVAPTRDAANIAYSEFIEVTSKLGLALSPDKCHPPTKTIEWLGFTISIDQMKVTIPQQKLDDTLEECQRWMQKTTASRKELQRLVGRLQHIAKCVPPARRFMSRIFAALRDSPYHGRAPVPGELQSDIKWFLEYARQSNGKVLLKTAEKAPWIIECDSSMKAGGAFSKNHYYGKTYPTDMTSKYTNIAHLEAINLIAAMRALAPNNPHEYNITINTDNSASQQVLASGAGRDPVLTACAREIWLYAASESCEVNIVHKPGRELILADALSRRAFDPVADTRAKTLVRQLNITETQVNFCSIFTDNL